MRFELRVDPLDHDCGVARLHAGRAEHDDTVADACVIGVDRGLAVLQALHQLAAVRPSASASSASSTAGPPLYLSPTTVTVVPLRAARRA